MVTASYVLNYCFKNNKNYFNYSIVSIIRVSFYEMELKVDIYYEVSRRPLIYEVGLIVVPR